MSQTEHDPLCAYGPEWDRMNGTSRRCPECEMIVLVRADERWKAAEEIARRIERMVPAHPKTWNGKWLIGRRMAAAVARRIGGAS